MVAAMNGHFTAVKLLLDAGANPNLADSYTNASKYIHITLPALGLFFV